ncbi:hypothetical protein FEM41_02030 [Jejubacter calystegiae]|uniref:Uncharacterized protein n=1 Tax=Jejubacter calystegiae TaxID=2579935 RepID=A0A4P8YF97_9ENTR|nr:hypothetical protein [Jejubacter calystegiae]QCT18503.1 hypothetical protein FEM41_02030 [Jejubacter calystegiae]
MADTDFWLQKIREQVCPNHSDAADYWDSLTPEWRGLVLHAAAICGRRELKPSLARCTWAELFTRTDPRTILQIRRGIQHGRRVFAGFGSLRDSDFSARTAKRDRKPEPAQKRGIEMVIAPDILAAFDARQQLNQEG